MQPSVSYSSLSRNACYVSHSNASACFGHHESAQCLGLFRTPRICCVSVPLVLCERKDAHSRAEQEVLQLSDSHLDFFSCLRVSFHCLDERSFSCISWRVRIDPILPTLLVFHFHLIHLKAVGPTVDQATLAFLAPALLLVNVGPLSPHIQALLCTAHFAAWVCS